MPRHSRYELRVTGPLSTDVFDGPEYAGLKSREVRGSERRGLHDSRPFDGDIDDIREGLQQPGVLDHAAVDAQPLDVRLRDRPPSRPSGRESGGRPIRAQPRGEMSRTGVAGEAEDRAARIRIPVRRPLGR